MNTTRTLTDVNNDVKVTRTVQLDIAASGNQNGTPRTTYTVKAGGRKFSFDGRHVKDTIDALTYLQDFSDYADDDPDVY